MIESGSQISDFDAALLRARVSVTDEKSIVLSGSPPRRVSSVDVCVYYNLFCSCTLDLFNSANVCAYYDFFFLYHRHIFVNVHFYAAISFHYHILTSVDKYYDQFPYHLLFKKWCRVEKSCL